MFRSKRDVDRHTQDIFRKLKNENERNLRCYNVAKLYYNVGDYSTCCHYASTYLATKEDSAPARKLLGQAREKLGLREEALREYKCSLELDGKQPDLVLKVCELLADLDVHVDTGRARYWCERADEQFPHHPAVFRLKQKLLAAEGDNNGDPAKLEKLISTEIVARPVDTNLRISLLRVYLKNRRTHDAYRHACDVEERAPFRNNIEWYDCVCEVFAAHLAESRDALDWQFFAEYVHVLDRAASLSLEETSHRALQECVQAVFRYDQVLHQAAAHSAPNQDRGHYQEYLAHHQAQLCLHLATLVLKRAKKEPSTWRESCRVAAPLLVGALTSPPDRSAAWLTRLTDTRLRVAQLWVREAGYRKSQAGHVVLGLVNETRTQFLERVAQFCAGNWRERIYQRLFTSREHHAAIETSHFVNARALAAPRLELPTVADLRPFDEESQELHPDSLQHHVWLGLQAINTTAKTPQAVFHAQVFGGLQLACVNPRSGGVESLDRLDVDAFLYAAVLCADSATRHRQQSDYPASSDQPSVLPCGVTGPLCPAAQCDWWRAAYRVYTADHAGVDPARVRLTLQRGIEVVRALGNHGMEPQLVVRLARMFAERAAVLSSRPELSDQATAIEARAALYWAAALPLLEKMQRKQVIYPPETRLFDYMGKDLSTTELDMLLEEGRLFVALQLMKVGDYEQAIERLHPLRSPDATFHAASIYARLADAEVDSEAKEAITSEMRSKHIIMLTKARDHLYLTVERLRGPSVDRKHPLNEVIGQRLADIESKLNRIDPDVCRNEANRNLDNLSDESVSSVRSGVDRLNLAGLGNGGGGGGSMLPLQLTPRHPQPPPPPHHHHAAGNSNNNRYTSTPYRHSRGAEQQYDERDNTRTEGAVETQLRNLSVLVSGKDQLMETIAQQTRALLDSNQVLQASVSALQASVSTILEDQKGIRSAMADIGELKKQVQELRAESSKQQRRGQHSADLTDDLYVFDEDYSEDVSLSAAQLAAANQYPQFPPYADYSNLRQMTGMLGTSTVTYGQPPVPAPQMLPADFFRNVDPALMYQVPAPPLGYYPHGALPFSDGQQLPDFRVPHYPPPPAATVVEIPPPKGPPPPVNVVITASDTLPTSTAPIRQPPLPSVTVPPQHRMGVLPPAGPHAFQISMPSQSLVPNASQLEKDSAALSPVIPIAVDTLLSSVPEPAYSAVAADRSLERSLGEREDDGTGSGEEGEHDPYFQPVIPLPAEVEVTTGEEEEEVLFQNRAKLYRFMENEWKERGVGVLKLLRHPASARVRLLMRREQVLKICANHLIARDMHLTVMNPRALIWAANDFADERVRLEKFCARFKTTEEAADFRAAFERAAESSPVEMSPAKPKEAAPKEKTKSPIAPPKLGGLFAPKGDALAAGTSPPKFTAGGFTFASTPKFKADADSMSSIIDEVAKSPEKPAEKPSPFAGFSFSAKPAEKKGDWNMFGTPAKEKPDTGLMFNSPHSDLSFTNVPAAETGFKKDSGFQGFAGAGKAVFGGTPSSSPGARKPGEEEGSGGGGDEFIPTAEFAPVIPLPDLVVVKTGEEGEITLFEDRAKLLRFNFETKEWKERGVGKFKILQDPATGKVRLLMRREQVLKVCCNHRLTAAMDIMRMKNNAKAYTWTAQDFSEGEVKPELFALSFKNSDLGLNFKDAIDRTQKAMVDDRLPVKAGKCAECAKKNVEDSSECEACTAIGARVGAAGDQPAAKPLSELFKAKPGSWECKSCYTRNDQDKTKCVSCESTNPAAPKPLSELFKAKPGSWECKSCYTRNDQDKPKCVACETPNPATPTAKPLSELFKAKAGSWECKSCYTRNEPERFTCVACEAAKPGHEKPPTKPDAPMHSFQFGIPATGGAKPAGVPLSELFKPKAGSWECKDCYSRNDGAASKCPACDAAKPGIAADSPAVAQKTSDTGSTLTFKPSPSTGSFNLGAAAAPATTPAGGFSFGMPAQQGAPKFSFGVAQVAATTAASSFGFGSTPLATNAGFGFGTTVTSAATTPKTDYGFGAIGTPASTPKTDYGFGAIGTTPTAAKPAAVAATVAATAAATTAFGEAKPFSFQSKAGGAFLFGSSAAPDKSSTGLTFGSSAPITIEKQRPSTPPNESEGSKLVFGSPGKEFSFLGVRPRSPGKSPRSPGRLLSCGEEGESEAEEGDEGDHIYFTPVIPLPDKVPVCTGEEEEEVLYCHRAKLFRFVSGEWKERGVGDFKILKHRTTSKIRLLMRREHVLKLCLNHFLSAELCLVPKDDKTWLWSAADYSDGTTRHEQFALRFKTPDVATEFKDALDAALADLTSRGDGSINVSATSATPLATPSATPTATPAADGSGAGEASPAMKGFSFSDYAATVKSHTPSPAPASFSMAGLLGSGDKTADVSRNLFGGSPQAAAPVDLSKTPGGGDLEVLYELHVTPEEEQAALRLQLPANFYSYRRKPPCPGCVGCDPAPDPSPILSGLLKTPSFIPPPPANLSVTPLFGPLSFQPAQTATPVFGAKQAEAATLFGGKPAAATPVFGMVPTPPVFGVKPAETTPIFGGKPAGPAPVYGGGTPYFGQRTTESTPMFGIKPAEVTPIFGGKPSEATPVFGGKPAGATPVFGGATPYFGQRTTESTPMFGAKPAEVTPIFGGKPSTAAPVFGGKPSAAAPVFGMLSTPPVFGKPAEPVSTSTPVSIFSKTPATTLGFTTPAGQEANGFVALAKEADEKAVSFLPFDASVSFSTLADSAAKVDKPIETVPNPSFAWSGAGSSLFGGSTPKTPLLATPTTPATPATPDGGAEEEEEEHDPQFAPIVPLPDAIEVRTGEEDEERVFCSRARLYRYQMSTSEWKERGIGEMKILRHPVSGKSRLLMRREQVHKVVLNQLITPDLHLKPLTTSDKAWCWGYFNYVDNEHSELEELAVRFKLAETAVEFYDAVQRCIAEVGAQRAEVGETSASAPEEVGEEEGDGDEEYEEYEGEEGEPEEPIFEKRVTLMTQGDQHDGWQTVGMGAVQVHAPSYYTGSEYNTVSMLHDGDAAPQFISTMREGTTIKRRAKCVLWSTMEYTDDTETVEVCRTYIAKFSSETAALEFYQVIGEGIVDDEEEDDSIPEV